MSPSPLTGQHDARAREQAPVSGFHYTMVAAASSSESDFCQGKLDSSLALGLGSV